MRSAAPIPRAAALLSEVDSMPDDLWERLHGTVRYLDSMTKAAAPPSHDVTDTLGRAVVGPGSGRVGGSGERHRR